MGAALIFKKIQTNLSWNKKHHNDHLFFKIFMFFFSTRTVTPSVYIWMNNDTRGYKKKGPERILPGPKTTGQKGLKNFPTACSFQNMIFLLDPLAAVLSGVSSITNLSNRSIWILYFICTFPPPPAHSTYLLLTLLTIRG